MKMLYPCLKVSVVFISLVSLVTSDFYKYSDESKLKQDGYKQHGLFEPERKSGELKLQPD